MNEIAKQFEQKLKDKEFEEALKIADGLGEKHPFKFFFRGRALQAQQKYQEALDELDAGLQKFPAQAHMYHQVKGGIYDQQKDFKLAAESFGKFVEIVKEKADQGTLTNYGRALLLSHQEEKAIPILEQAYKMNEKSQPGQMAQGNLAKYYFENNKHQEALAIFEKICENMNMDKNQQIIIWKNRGVCEQNLMKNEQAIKSFEKVLELDPNYAIQSELVTVYFNETINFCKNQDYEKCLQVSEKVIQLIKDDSDERKIEALSCRAESLSHLKKDGLIEVYEQLIKLRPNIQKNYVNLGNHYLKQNKIPQAIEVYEKAIQNCGPSFEIYNNLAEGYEKDTKKSLEYLTKAIEMNPDSIISLCRRAGIYSQQKLQQDAMKDLKRVDELAKNPKNLAGLSDIQKKFIDQSVQKIIEITQAFEQEKKAILEKLASDAKNEEMMKKILAEFDSIQNEIDAQNQAEMNVFLKEQQQAQQPKLNREELKKKFDAITQRIEESQQKIEVKKEEIIVQQVKEDIKIEKITKQVDELEECMQVVGLDRIAKVKDTYDKWRTEYIEGYNYAKAFYWTFINYCDAQKIASTGIINKVSGNAVGSTTKVAVKVTQAVLDFGSSIPVFGAIFSAINMAIGAVYEEYEKFQDEKKQNAILKVIMKNQDADDKEAWSMLVANAAQIIAARKRKYFEAERQVQKKSTLDSVIDWVSDKIKKIKDVASGQKVDLYESWGGEEASQDIVILLAFIMKNHDEMVTNTSQPLDITIADIVYLEDGVVSPQFQSMLDQVKKREEIENPSKKQVDQRDDSCACQLI